MLRDTPPNSNRISNFQSSQVRKGRKQALLIQQKAGKEKKKKWKKKKRKKKKKKESIVNGTH